MKLSTCQNNCFQLLMFQSCYSRFRDSSPVCPLHTAITHMIIVLEPRSSREFQWQLACETQQFPVLWGSNTLLTWVIAMCNVQMELETICAVWALHTAITHVSKVLKPLRSSPEFQWQLVRELSRSGTSIMWVIAVCDGQTGLETWNYCTASQATFYLMCPQYRNTNVHKCTFFACVAPFMI